MSGASSSTGGIDYTAFAAAIVTAMAQANAVAAPKAAATPKAKATAKAKPKAANKAHFALVEITKANIQQVLASLGTGLADVVGKMTLAATVVLSFALDIKFALKQNLTTQTFANKGSKSVLDQAIIEEFMNRINTNDNDIWRYKISKSDFGDIDNETWEKIKQYMKEKTDNMIEELKVDDFISSSEESSDDDDDDDDDQDDQDEQGGEQGGDQDDQDDQDEQGGGDDNEQGGNNEEQQRGVAGTTTPLDEGVDGETPRDDTAPAFGVGLCWGLSVRLRAFSVRFLFLASPLWGQAARPSGCEACVCFRRCALDRWRFCCFFFPALES